MTNGVGIGEESRGGTRTRHPGAGVELARLVKALRDGPRRLGPGAVLVVPAIGRAGRHHPHLVTKSYSAVPRP